MADIPAISGVDDPANVRVVLIQGKQQVNAPLTGLGFLPLDGSLPMTGDLDMGSHNIKNVVQITSPTGLLELLEIDATANAGPFYALYRDSSSPAANDGIGGFVWWGRDSAGNKQAYAQISVIIEDPTNTSEDSRIEFYTQIAGAFTLQQTFSPTGTSIKRPLDLSGAAASQIVFGNANNSANTATLDGYTDWIAYTPTFTGFGTVSGVSIWSKRVGDSLMIRGKFTSGTSTAVEARMTLGFNGTNSNVTSDATKVASIQLAGPLVPSFTAANAYYVLIESNIGYITFSVQNAGNAGLTKAIGTVMAASGNVLSFTAEVPITGW